MKILKASEDFIIENVQKYHFGEEILAISTNKKIHKSSMLRKLDPVLKDGILRIGGRIDRAPLPYETRHPIILPKCSVVSKLILADIHERLGHLGKGYVINDMRETYWIIGAWCSCVAKNYNDKVCYLSQVHG